MSNGQDLVCERQFESLAAAVANEYGTLCVDFTGANASIGGLSGLVPAPKAGEENYFLRGDGTWVSISGGGDSGGGDSGGGNLPTAGTELEDCTWGEISAVSQAGTGDTYWDVGDCKEITLNGKVGDYLTLDNETLCVFILHFNYALNGTPDNNIIWGGFKTVGGVDVALVDSKYEASPTDGTICFNMNHWGASNYGGWKGCDLRYDILGATSTQPSDYGKAHTSSNVGYDATAETLTSPKADTLLAALPSDFRSVLRLWSRWVDAKGNNSNVDENIEETIDAVTLLTEFEIHGARSYANQYEQNHQTQMAYYSNGNSKLKKPHSIPSVQDGYSYWYSSPRGAEYATHFCNAYRNGTVYANDATFSYGIAPAFMT